LIPLLATIAFLSCEKVEKGQTIQEPTETKTLVAGWENILKTQLSEIKVKAEIQLQPIQ
jgi:hypothetical protein